jgi:hypothetical protein
MVPTPEEVQGLWQLVLFIVSSYLIYLRVSGLFHVIIGILCLFGFNLPETHHHYFLAAEFNEVWRRLNIYWKDFMAKVLYYPLVMKIRKWGMMRARVLGTMLVFVATWLLHSYQWFWLRGSFPLNAIDGLYWGVLGMFVVINTVRVTKDLRGQDDEDQGWSWALAAKQAGTILGLFLFMSVLWSFWSSESIASWWSLMLVATEGSLQEYGLLVLGFTGVFGLVVLHLFMAHRGWSLLWDEKKLPFSSVAARTSVGALALLAIGLPTVYSKLPDSSSEFIASLQESHLNDRDRGIQERGYYEGLIDGNSYTSQVILDRSQEQPDDWRAIMESNAIRPGEDVMAYELAPSFSGNIKDAPFNTNEWGMRDKPYTKEKPAGTFRIAFLGASYEQGAGVDDALIYPELLEDLLNEHHAGQVYENYEVLNFAVGGYSPLQNLYFTENRVLDFQPDVILYAIHSTERRRLQMQIQKLNAEEREVSYPFLQEALVKADLSSDMPPQEVRRRLDPLADEIIRQSFLRMGQKSRESGVPIIGAFVPSTEEIKGYDRKNQPLLISYAKESDFKVIILDGAYAGHTEEDIQLAPWDTHLSVMGHRLVADRFYRALVEHDAELHLGLSETVSSAQVQ